MRKQILSGMILLLGALPAWAAPTAGAAGAGPAGVPVLLPADSCISCHTGVVTPTGEDLSFAPQWQSSMMANAGRDPYWMAAVRRETTDHPRHRALIEDECSICHLPMARYLRKAAGAQGEVFAFLPGGKSTDPLAPLAADGVSCTLCHQLGAGNLGQPATFTGGFSLEAPAPGAAPRVNGPFQPDPGRQRIMSSSSGYVPVEQAHLGQAELCASCHTLITAAFGPDGEHVGELPEQVPYLEWKESDYRESQPCQACHLPEAIETVPVTPVLGEPRDRVSAHSFQGGNAFMLRILNRYRQELGVPALPADLDAAVARTEAHLGNEAATLALGATRTSGGGLRVEIEVRNRAGHKLPTAYPSRRAWIHLIVRDRNGEIVFESGAVQPDGQIAGNDNAADAARFEPHYDEISHPDQVQIYEAILGDPRGGVTTGLLTAVRYLKDNRLLPRGFDKRRVPKEVAVWGEALADGDFSQGGDRIRYRIDSGDLAGPCTVEARLCYQSIGYRWARNLAGRPDAEGRRFTEAYAAMAAVSTSVLASGTAKVE